MKKTRHTNTQQQTDQLVVQRTRGAWLVASALASMAMMAGNQAWAAPGSCGNGGTSTISGTETTQCAPASSERVVVTSSGTIQTSGSGVSAVTLSIDSASTNVSIENHGTIDSIGSTAIVNKGSITGLTNTGFITGGSNGASIDNLGTITSINNSGTMSSGYGIYNRNTISTIGTIINSGTIETSAVSAIYNNNGATIDAITNSGTIRTSSTYAIENKGTITNGITNTGLIDGAISLGAATLHLDGTQGRVTGAIDGSTGSAIVVNGNFTQENTITTHTVTIANTGELTLSGSHNLNANVTNNGRVVVTADTSHAHIGGNYHQTAGAILEIGASGSSYGEHGGLHVVGNATFDAGTGLHVNVSQQNTLANNNVLSSVVYTDGLTASTFTVTDNSFLFNFEAIVNGNNIDLKTIAANSVLDSVNHQGFNQGTGAARVLDNFMTGGATGDMSTVVTALGQMGSEREVSNAVAQTLPLMSASLDQVTTNSMRGTNRVIQARQEGNVGRSSGEGFLGDKHFWFKPIASRADQNNRNGVAGYNADTYGFLMGADAEVNDNSRVGVAFSYMNSNVDGKSTARYNGADIKAYQIIGYGSHNLASDPDVEINWQADFGINKNDGRRTINFGGLNRVAKSDFDSTTAHVGAGISRNVQLNERTAFIPSIRADYFWIRNESYTEKGADALNLKVGSATSEQLIAMVEGRLQHKLTDRAALTANVGVGYDLFDEQNSITASYVGGGAAFRTQGLELSPWIGRAGLGLTVNATERTEITARYDAEGRSDFVGQTASLKVRWAF